jgi:ABC-2 type transport system permease protein
MRTSSLRRDVGLAAWQVLYEQRSFWRNRAGAFFALFMPLMFLVIFASIFNGKAIMLGHGQSIPYVTWFIPGILAYGVISTTFVNIGIVTAVLRDDGVLKRMAGTPLPTWAYVAGRIGSTAIITLAITVIDLGVGRVAYGVHVRSSTLPGLIVTLALGSAAFTALGVGIVRYVSNAEAAPAVVNFAILPLTFISGIWFHMNLSPTLTDIAKIFPVRALAHGFQYAFNPFTRGSGFESSDLLTLAIWLVVGVVAMLAFLRKPDRG